MTREVTVRRFIEIVAVSMFLALWSVHFAVAEPKDVNYDEAKVPNYVLPDPLRMRDGTQVADPETWRTKRRSELVGLFEEHVYGRSPKPAGRIQFEVTSVDPQALGGKATRKEVAVFLTGKRDGPTMDILLYLPNGAQKPAPAFLGLNFFGNHSVQADPRGIKVSVHFV